MKVLTKHVLQGLQTTYMGPTTHKGPRVKVHAYKKWSFYHWDRELDVEQNHHSAAVRFCESLGWSEAYDLVCGSNHNQKGYHYVMVPKERKAK